MTLIIRPGKSELLAEVMGGGLTDMFQDLISAGTRRMSTPMLLTLTIT